MSLETDRAQRRMTGPATDKALFWEREKRSWPNREASRFVAAAGIRWHIQQAGTGPWLLLLHGTGASVHTWRDLLPLLARHYTVLAVDLPGQGFSEALRGGITIDAMSAAVTSLLRVLGVDPDYCVGHSAGAAILCRMALDGSIAPRHIVSINGAFLPFGGAAGLVFKPIAKLFAASSTAARMIAWRARSVAAVENVLAGTGSKLDAAGIDLYARLTQDPGHIAGALAMMSHWDLRGFSAELANLRVPLTLVVGEADRAVPAAQAAEVQAQLPTARIVSLPGLGHLAHEEAPTRLAGVIEQALRGG
jgi:magnesium chelatase accessory protein